MGGDVLGGWWVGVGVVVGVAGICMCSDTTERRWGGGVLVGMQHRMLHCYCYCYSYW